MMFQFLQLGFEFQIMAKVEELKNKSEGKEEEKKE